VITWMQTGKKEMFSFYLAFQKVALFTRVAPRIRAMQSP
jgi:hypothetical protein